MKIIVLLFALLACTTVLVHAQTKANPKTSPHKEVPKSNEVKSHPVKNMVRADTTKLPAGLKETLSEQQYKGWQKGILYFDKKTNEYALLLNDSISEKLKNNTEIMGKVAPKQTGWHFFTKEGKPIDVAQ